MYLPPVRVPSQLQNFDWPTDELADANLAYSTCEICLKKLKGRCFSETCLHKFCLHCSFVLIRVRNQEKIFKLIFIIYWYFLHLFLILENERKTWKTKMPSLQKVVYRIEFTSHFQWYRLGKYRQTIWLESSCLFISSKSLCW